MHKIWSKFSRQVDLNENIPASRKTFTSNYSKEFSHDPKIVENIKTKYFFSFVAKNKPRMKVCH